MKGGNLYYQDNHQNFNSPMDLHMKAGCHPYMSQYKEQKMNAWGPHHMQRLVLRG